MSETFPVQRITRQKIRTELLGQGQRMSNWLYNLKQSSEVPKWVRDEAEYLQVAWDEIKKKSEAPAR